MWGPEPAALAGVLADIERDRGAADKAVRENYKILAQRAKPQDARAIVGEQAGFSAEREIACRAYARESAHGFCNARIHGSPRRGPRGKARYGAGRRRTRPGADGAVSSCAVPDPTPPPGARHAAAAPRAELRG